MSKETLSKPVSTVPLEPVVTISAEAKPLKELMAPVSKPKSPPPPPPDESEPPKDKPHTLKEEKSSKRPPPRPSRPVKVNEKKKNVKRKVTFYFDKDRTYMSNFMTNVKLSPEMQRDLKSVLGDEQLWTMKGEHLVSDTNGFTGINGEKKESLVREVPPKDYYNQFLKDHGYRVEAKKMTGFSMYPVVTSNWTKVAPAVTPVDAPVQPVVLPPDVTTPNQPPPPAQPKPPQAAATAPPTTGATATPGTAPQDGTASKPKADVKVRTKPSKKEEEEVEEIDKPQFTSAQIQEIIVTNKDLRNSLAGVEEKLSAMSETFMKLTDVQQSVMAKFDVSNKVDSQFNVRVWKAVLGGFLRLEGDDIDEPLGAVLKDPSNWTKRSFWSDLADDIIGAEED